ncbi:MAG: hypothetical protein H6672_10485 [Anaerolineaceae bacterium]|nr:hypothetical protein [Anaerolineaceae bacterium]
MVKQRHIQLLLIPGALLLFALFMTAWSIQAQPASPSWQAMSDLSNTVFATIKVDIPSECGLGENYYTRHWREALSESYTFTVPEPTIPQKYPLVAIIGTNGGSFIHYIIGWFQTASP